ncbi:hypothetical protein AB0G00_29560 [Nocardia salmonicida]|uniref:hypothetical protein n=1 Tax=Nocardia salmonicida TaxID=53431 RepID=UPI00340BF6BF
MRDISAGFTLLAIVAAGLLMASSCGDSTTTAEPEVPEVQPVFVGSVVAVTRDSITIQAEDRQETVLWARLNYGGACALEIVPAAEVRLRALAPVGASVTVIREPVRAEPARDSQYAYIHLGAPGSAATLQPYGVSINEQIVAEGNSGTSPEIDRRPTAATAAVQTAATRSEIQAPYLAAFDAVVAANVAAWDIRAGALGRCQNRFDRERADRVEKWGMDERPGTDDDPIRNQAPYVNSGGGGGGGGGESRFCRKRWWC